MKCSGHTIKFVLQGYFHVNCNIWLQFLSIPVQLSSKKTTEENPNWLIYPTNIIIEWTKVEESWWCIVTKKTTFYEMFVPYESLDEYTLKNQTKNWAFMNSKQR